MATAETVEYVKPFVDARRLDFVTYCPGVRADALAIESGGQHTLVDSFGDKYIDFGVGGEVMIVGHRNSAVEAVMMDQVVHYGFTGMYTDHMHRYVVEYARALSERFPADERGNPQQVMFYASYAQVADALDQIGTASVADEYDTGFGRTGRFVSEEAEVTVLGPQGGYGLPFAAIVAPSYLLSELEPPRAVSPVVCAAGHAVLDQITPELMEHAVDMGILLTEGITRLGDQFPIIEGCVGQGLNQRIILTQESKSAQFQQQCLERGLIIHRDLRVTPPLIVTEDIVSAAIDVIADVLLDH